MNRDPTKVGRAKVGAELIAEVVNGFVEPISWKTLVRLRFKYVIWELTIVLSCSYLRYRLSGFSHYS